MTSPDVARWWARLWAPPERRLRLLELRRLCRFRVEEFEESKIREEIRMSRVSLRDSRPLEEWDR